MRKSHFVCVAIAIFVIACFAFADAGSIAVVTTKGVTLHLGELSYGYSKIVAEGERINKGLDVHGNPIYNYKNTKTEFYETDEIPLKIGDGFGFKFRLPSISVGDELVIRIVAEFPQSVRKNGKELDKLEGDLVYKNEDSNITKNLIWSFSRKDPEYHLPGKWKLSLYNRGNLLINHDFIVTN